MQNPRRHKRSRKKKAAEAEATTAAAAQAVAMAAAVALMAAADGKTITKNNADAAEASEAASEAQETEIKDKEIPALIQERKTTAKHEKERIRKICKKLKNASEKKKRTTRQGKIQKILEELKGTRKTSSVPSQ